MCARSHLSNSAGSQLWDGVGMGFGREADGADEAGHSHSLMEVVTGGGGKTMRPHSLRRHQAPGPRPSSPWPVAREAERWRKRRGGRKAERCGGGRTGEVTGVAL